MRFRVLNQTQDLKLGFDKIASVITTVGSKLLTGRLQKKNHEMSS